MTLVAVGSSGIQGRRNCTLTRWLRTETVSVRGNSDEKNNALESVLDFIYRLATRGNIFFWNLADVDHGFVAHFPPCANSGKMSIFVNANEDVCAQQHRNMTWSAMRV